MTVWKNEKLSDSTRLAAIDRATWHGYLFKNPDSAFYYAQIQYDFAAQVGNKMQMGNALNTQGVSYSMRGEYALALETLAGSLEIRLEIDHLYGIAKSYMNMGPAYSNQGDFVSALDVYQRSLAISEPNNFERLISASLNNIGVIYDSQKDYTKALEYYLQGLKLAKEINNKRVEANLISNISVIYRNQGNWDAALEYANNGLQLFEEIGDIKGVASAYEGIGLLYHEKKEYNKSIAFQLKALKIRESINDKLGLASIMVSLGSTHLQKKQPKQGEIWCEKGLKMAISIGSLTYKKSACQCLYESTTEQGLWKEALGYYQKYIIYSDSLRTNETVKRLQQLEFAKQIVRDSLARETARIEANNVYEAKIYRRNSLQYMGISIVLLLLVGWWFFASRMNLPKWLIDLSLFVPFLMFFSFMENLTEPFADAVFGDTPVHKMIVSVILAALITPSHRIIERLVRNRLFESGEEEEETDDN